jgi:hypothetical protein
MREACLTLSLTNAALLVRGIPQKLGFYADLFNTHIRNLSGRQLQYIEMGKGAAQSLVLRVNEPKRADVCTL